jgi:hypothetical protein
VGSKNKGFIFKIRQQNLGGYNYKNLVGNKQISLSVHPEPLKNFVNHP